MPESLKTKVLKDFTPVTEINQATLPTNNDYNFTDNLGLIQPGQNNYYDIRESCFNMEILDRIINNMLTAGYSKEEIDSLLSGIDTQLAQIMPETGIFTPTIKGSTTAGAHTYSQQQGKYTKIGNQVFFSLNIIITAKDGTMAGGVQIGGLPFAQSIVPYESISIGSININMTDTAKSVGGLIAGSNISLYEFFDNANTVALPSTAILATTQIRCSGVYEIA